MATVAPASAPAQRQPGRPRSETADRAILEATLDLLAEQGPVVLSMDAVAARAGVSKATIYRRHQSKVDLLIAALGGLDRVGPDPDPSLSTRDALIELLEALRQRKRESRADQLFPVILGSAQQEPELFQRFVSVVLQPRRDRLNRVLARGVERGEIRGDVDLALLHEFIIGPLLHQLMMAGAGWDPAPRMQVRAYVDLALRGAAPSSPG